MSVRPSVGPSVSRTSVRLSFPDDNLGKNQWIFTKLGMCIDIIEIWFEIANGQISSNVYGVICPRHDSGGVWQRFVLSTCPLGRLFSLHKCNLSRRETQELLTI